MGKVPVLQGQCVSGKRPHRPFEANNATKILTLALTPAEPNKAPRPCGSRCTGSPLPSSRSS